MNQERFYVSYSDWCCVQINQILLSRDVSRIIQIQYKKERKSLVEYEPKNWYSDDSEEEKGKNFEENSQ